MGIYVGIQFSNGKILNDLANEFVNRGIKSSGHSNDIMDREKKNESKFKIHLVNEC